MNIIDQLEEKIEEWVCKHDWSSEDIVGSVMADTHSVFMDWPEDVSIILEKAGDCCYIFSCDFTLSGQIRDEKVSFYSEQIDVNVKGSITYKIDELDEDDFDYEIIEKWIIDDEFTVSASENDGWCADDTNEALTTESRDSVESQKYLKKKVEAPRIDDKIPVIEFAFMQKSSIYPAADDILKELANLDFEYWFRGHADISWELKSTVARENLKKHQILRLRLEFDRRTAFLQPEAYPLDRVKRIFLMRHHNLPTKIMDWSRSPLVALYFAIQDKTHDEKDACIWLLKRKHVEYDENVEELLKCEDSDQTLEEKTKKIVAIHSPYTNQRMVNQQSQFTLHRNYEDMANSPELNLEKIIIPAETKQYLRKMLKTFGIDRAFLFPDYDNICAQIREDILESNEHIFDRFFERGKKNAN